MGGKIVLVDQDNTIADFDGGFLKKWRGLYPDLPYVELVERKNFYNYDDYPSELKDKVMGIYHLPGFIAELEPIGGAVEALREMKEAGLVVKICTSPLTGNSDCLKEKHDWVTRHLGKEWLRDLIISTDKTIVFGDYLIDDRPMPKGEREPVWEHVIFDRPYNREVVGKRRLERWLDWRKVL